MAMLDFEVYFDDSGTDGKSAIAVAACYISTVRGWTAFVDEWDRIRREEGFKAFHMSHFAAKNTEHDPYCNWDREKKTRVYQRLAKTINQNKSIGIAVAVPKIVYDQSPQAFRSFYGQEHYTFAVRMCLKLIAKWRSESMRWWKPMQYFFDWEMQGLANEKRSISCGRTCTTL